MNTKWETFEGRQYGRTARREARVTLAKKSVIYMNGIAYNALGRPGAVEMLYDGNRRIIGLRPVDPKKRNAFKIMRHGTGNYRRISASAFCQHYRIRTDRTVLFQEVDVDSEGVMTLDMNRTVVVARGAR